MKIRAVKDSDAAKELMASVAKLKLERARHQSREVIGIVASEIWRRDTGKVG